MITGAHAIIFSRDAEALRALLRDVLELPAVDAGHGWLIFALPGAELAAHPAGEDAGRHALYLTCDDLRATVEQLTSRGARLARPITQEAFGVMTAISLPGGGELGLYEPHHPSPLGAAG